MTEVPNVYRGSVFSFVIKLGESVPSGMFDEWTPNAQVRIKGNRLPKGVLANLSITPIPDQPEHFLIHTEDTSCWPMGLVEIDIAFVHPVTGRAVYSMPRQLMVLGTVTKLERGGH